MLYLRPQSKAKMRGFEPATVGKVHSAIYMYLGSVSTHATCNTHIHNTGPRPATTPRQRTYVKHPWHSRGDLRDEVAQIRVLKCRAAQRMESV